VGDPAHLAPQIGHITRKPSQEWLVSHDASEGTSPLFQVAHRLRALWGSQQLRARAQPLARRHRLGEET